MESGVYGCCVDMWDNDQTSQQRKQLSPSGAMTRSGLCLSIQSCKADHHACVLHVCRPSKLMHVSNTNTAWHGCNRNNNTNTTVKHWYRYIMPKHHALDAINTQALSALCRCLTLWTYRKVRSCKYVHVQIFLDIHSYSFLPLKARIGTFETWSHGKASSPWAPHSRRHMTTSVQPASAKARPQAPKRDTRCSHPLRGSSPNTHPKSSACIVWRNTTAATPTNLQQAF